MTDNYIATMLDELASAQAKRDVIAMNKQAAIDAVMTDEIRAKLAEIDANYDPVDHEALEDIERLTRQVKETVIASGATCKGTFLQAVYMKGRTSWDGKALEGFSAAHPEILTFRTIGEPSVSIRGVR